MTLTADLKEGDKVIVVVHSTRTGKTLSRREAEVIERTRAGYICLPDQRCYRWNGERWTEKLTFNEAMIATVFRTLEDLDEGEAFSDGSGDVH
jgi:hypothetical protein